MITKQMWAANVGSWLWDPRAARQSTHVDTCREKELVQDASTHGTSNIKPPTTIINPSTIYIYIVDVDIYTTLACVRSDVACQIDYPITIVPVS